MAAEPTTATATTDNATATTATTTTIIEENNSNTTTSATTSSTTTTTSASASTPPTTDAIGWTLLHTAAKVDDLSGLTTLLSNGADINAKTVLGVQPLHVAVSRADIGIVSVLLKHGADVNVADCQGFTPCHRAIKRGNVRMLKLLLAAGALARVADKHGETLCHHAVASGNKHLLVPLIAAGASVVEVDLGGKSPIHAAVGDEKMLALLLVAGADPNALDRNGNPVWVLAELRHARPSLALLHAAGHARPAPNPANSFVTTKLEFDAATRTLAVAQFDVIKSRAVDICVGLHGLELNALQLCEILKHSCGELQFEVPFHLWWNLAVAVKHFHERERKPNETNDKTNSNSITLNSISPTATNWSEVRS